MYKVAKPLSILGVAAVLAIIGSWMNVPRAKAQSGPASAPGAPVMIVGPLPVPVSGTSNVSGTVAATQSGAWKVGLTSGTVVLNKNLDEPGRSPYQESLRGHVNLGTCGTAECGVEFMFSQVPNGKRLVVTDLFAGFRVLAGASVAAGSLETSSGPGFFMFPMSFQAAYKATWSGLEQWSTHQQMRVFFDPLQSPTVFLNVDPAHAAPTETSFVSLTGYYVSID